MFKLLGITIDDGLTFTKYVNVLRKKVNRKLFAKKNIFFLSEKIKLQFFKTFLLPHFDYCASLFIYFGKTQIDNINRLYNSCLFNLLRIDLHDKPLEEQARVLTDYNLMPFKYRLFYRFSIFSYKIINRFILHNINDELVQLDNSKNLRDATRNLYYVPSCRTMMGAKRISVCLPQLINKVMRSSFNLNFCDFKNFILDNLSILFVKFQILVKNV